MSKIYHYCRFVTCLVWLPIAAIGCTQNAPDQTTIPTTAATSAPAATARERFDGFSFDLPTGWLRITPDRPKTKAQLLLGSDRWDTAKGMIKVDVGTPATSDPKAMAEGLAKNFGGSLLKDPSVVDGEQAFQVQSPRGVGMTPRKGIVVFHRGQAVLVMAGAVGDTEVSAALEQVRSTWKWSE